VAVALVAVVLLVVPLLLVPLLLVVLLLEVMLLESVLVVVPVLVVSTHCVVSAGHMSSSASSNGTQNVKLSTAPPVTDGTWNEHWPLVPATQPEHWNALTLVDVAVTVVFVVTVPGSVPKHGTLCAGHSRSTASW
jgi:hypothetical protein